MTNVETIDGQPLVELPRILATKLSKVSALPLALAVILCLSLPCYLGLAAGDSPENKALLAYVNNLAAGKGVRLYIDIHSYSQLFMTREPFP